MKPVYIVVFCREAMKRCGITLATPCRDKFIVHPYLSYPGTLGPISGISPLETLQHAPATPITTPNCTYLRCLLKTAS